MIIVIVVVVITIISIVVFVIVVVTILPIIVVNSIILSYNMYKLSETLLITLTTIRELF